MDKKLAFFIWSAVLAGMVMLVNSAMQSSNRFYVDAYRPSIKQSQEIQQLERQVKQKNDDLSEEPQAPGLREKDIKKTEGNRYKTW